MPWSGSGAAAARGWPAKDVVAHLGALFWMVVDPSTPPDADGAPTEEANEVHVATRRPMTPAWSQLTGFAEDPGQRQRSRRPGGTAGN